VPQSAGEGDNRPLSIFAAALRGPVGGHETSVAAFFGNGTRAAPAAVSADRLRGATASPAAGGLPQAPTTPHAPVFTQARLPPGTPPLLPGAAGHVRSAALDTHPPAAARLRGDGWCFSARQLYYAVCADVETAPGLHV